MNKVGCQMFTAEIARRARRVTRRRNSSRCRVPTTVPRPRSGGFAHPPRPPLPHLGHPRRAYYTAQRAPIAQLVELRTFNPQVVGSSPTGGTRRGGGRARAPRARRGAGGGGATPPVTAKMAICNMDKKKKK